MRSTIPSQRVRRAVLAMAVLAAAAWLVAFAGRALVGPVPMSDPDAVVSLASHEWERLPTLARVGRSAPEAVILLTQPERPTPANCHRCAERVAWLQRLGTPGQRVVVLPMRVENTYEEALAVAAYRHTAPIRRLMVVTSPYHARRALAVFTAVLGSDVLVGVQPATEHSVARPNRWWLSSYDRAYVVYEWAALAWYTVRYGVNPIVPLHHSMNAGQAATRV